MPGRRQRTRLRLPIADNTGGNKPGIIENGAESMTERITQLAAFMDRPRTFGRYMARYTARERELFE